MSLSNTATSERASASRDDVRLSLQQYLLELIPGSSDMTVNLSEEAMKAGFSAETILFKASYRLDQKLVEERLVFRRQIPGQEVNFDASLITQARIMDALQTRTSLPVPRVFGMDEEENRFGAPFLIMEQLPGRIVPQLPNYHREGWVASLDLPERAAVWERAIRAVAAVNRVDWRNGLEFLDNPNRGTTGLQQYLSWVEEWLHWALGERSHPVAEAAVAYLRANAPVAPPVNLVWGDAIPANLLFDADNNVSGIIDWEWAFLGPAEIDLAWWLYFDRLFSEDFNVPRLEGLPDRDTTIRTYEEALGRPVSDLPYYEILCGLRMVIATMRSVDRLVGAGRLSRANTSWLNSPSCAWVARQLGLDPVAIGPDFGEFTAALFDGR
ncbi:phosphotransferase family protein [Sphingomonas populi]|uniref:Phosphotransferase family protein n=1 Tax=Sphingomonas populi TaxID=2484750 RepID=A0A4V2DD19_9SPHN|nr:phosphotransferase family protein [Sphingomonas populi]RZF63448.1 phosphotransferase family protein [Sphingomonas populi]